MKNYKNRFNNRGFTLMELMIVIAIIGILASVAYPQYVDSVKRAKRGDAIKSLLLLDQRMIEYYGLNKTYATATIAALGGTNSSDGLYTLAISDLSLFGYKLTATPVETDIVCGNLILDSLGQKTDSKSNGNCW